MSCFKLGASLLPVSSELPHPMTRPVVSPTPTGTVPFSSSKTTPILREMMAQLLTLGGFRAETASNGREALQIPRPGDRPDVILLDLMMPVMDGWEFRRQQAEPIRRLPPVPVVVLSALDQARAGDLGGTPLSSRNRSISTACSNSCAAFAHRPADNMLQADGTLATIRFWPGAGAAVRRARGAAPHGGRSGPVADSVVKGPDSAAPLLARRSVAAIDRSVDLPAPLWPRSAVIVPARAGERHFVQGAAAAESARNVSEAEFLRSRGVTRPRVRAPHRGLRARSPDARDGWRRRARRRFPCAVVPRAP